MTTTTAELASLVSLDAALESARAAGAGIPGTTGAAAAGATAAWPSAAGEDDVLAAARVLLVLSSALPVPAAGPPV